MSKPVPRKPGSNPSPSKTQSNAVNKPRPLGQPSKSVLRQPKAAQKKSGEDKVGTTKKRGRGKKKEWSIRTVAIAMAVVIAFLGWSFAAAHYAQATEGWRAVDTGAHNRPEFTTDGQKAALGWLTHVQGLLSFFGNGFVQLRNLPFVVVHILKNAIWLPVIFLLLEGGVVLFVWYDRKLRQDWKGLTREPVRHE